ncbi:hypothetical protein LPJ72_000894 [Coemansia sp. Benny D160-2]|nr:hypothetical protein LPJ72_000894 [Coemansia sp. Benny D160-2]
MLTKTNHQNSAGSNSGRQLFIRDGDDVFIQRSSKDAESNNASSGFRTSVYKHFESNMRVVVCRTPSPIYTLNIYVPTAVTDNKGLPHTLEHLVFCGSKRYPTPGYLDVLATHNYSVGTNAWTRNDCTCYTFSASAEDGVANVLPVFLDHVLNPILSDANFTTEVYHYDETGKENGVVFCEMSSKENKENILSIYHLKKLMYNSSATFAHYSGGKTYGIASLTNKEIIDYHHKYYDANNVTVLLTGAFSDDFEERYLQKIPADIIKSHGNDSRAPMHCFSPDVGRPKHETVRFPSADTSTGSFEFGWQGPPQEDIETTIALEILMEYLGGNPSSPLRLRFVKRATPLAGSVSASVSGNVASRLVISLNRVPYTCPTSAESSKSGSDSKTNGVSGGGGSIDDQDIPHLFEENYTKNLLIKELERVYETRFNGDAHALENAAKRQSDSLAAHAENSPGKLLQTLFYFDIVASHFSPGSLGKVRIGSCAKQFDILAELSKRPIEFWLDLLKKWFIDAAVYSVAAIPDPELGSELEAKRKEKEQENAAKIVDKEAHIKFIKDSAEANTAQITDEIKHGIPRPDSTMPSSIPHTQSLVVLDRAIGPVAAVQTINSESSFVKVRIQIPIGTVPHELRAYLALFQALLLKTDLVLPAGVVYENDEKPLQAERRIPYSEFTGRMSDLVTSRLAYVGLGSYLFSDNPHDNAFLVDFYTPHRNYLLALRWTVQGLLFSDFTLERILTSAKNALTRITSIKRSTESIAGGVGVHFTDVLPEQGQLSNKHHMLFLAQEGLLKNILAKAKSGKGDEIIGKLKDIQSALVQATGGFMALSLPSSEESKPYIDALESEWKMCFEKYAQRSNLDYVDAKTVTKSPFPMIYNSNFPDLEKPIFVHVPVESLQTSESNFYLKLDIPFRPTSKCSFNDDLDNLIALDYFALRMLAALIGRSGGPLYNAIRGKGYSYGVHLYILAQSKLFLRIFTASDVVKAIGAAKQLFLDIQQNWDAHVSETDISLARSIVKYNITASQSTPINMLLWGISNSRDGFSSAEEHNMWCNTHIAAVKMSDLRRVFEKYMFKFADDDCPMLRLIVTPSDTKVPAELGPYEQKTLEEICATYKSDY